MNGELAQAIALVAHGNATLAGRGETRHFEQRNSTFQFIRSLTMEIPGRWRTRTVTSVEEWMQALPRAGVERLSLVGSGAPPSAFANQGGWAIQGQTERGAHVWHGSWKVNRDGIDPQARTWEVSYPLGQRNGPAAADDVDIAAAKSELSAALNQASDFAARDSHLTTFHSLFDRALALGEADCPTAPYHADMLPTEGYSVAARQLMAMASQAWVFGGMGSWTDLGFDDASTTADFQRVSARLYRAVVDAARSAANAFEPG